MYAKIPHIGTCAALGKVLESPNLGCPPKKWRRLQFPDGLPRFYVEITIAWYPTVQPKVAAGRFRWFFISLE
jgi:hypothetical protein